MCPNMNYSLKNFTTLAIIVFVNTIVFGQEEIFSGESDDVVTEGYEEDVVGKYVLPDANFEIENRENFSSNDLTDPEDKKKKTHERSSESGDVRDYSGEQAPEENSDIVNVRDSQQSESENEKTNTEEKTTESTRENSNIDNSDDDSVLTFNFIYYLLKFKFSEVIE